MSIVSDDPDFQMSVGQGPEGTVLTLKGSISERTTIQPPAQLGSTVVIDGGDVERINSMGVRTWLNFFDGLSKHGVPIVIRRMSPALVLQASMITNFIGGAEVESFLAPYYCPDCEHTFEQLLGGTDPVPEELPCPKCKSTAELDSELGAYQAFRQG